MSSSDDTTTIFQLDERSHPGQRADGTRRLPRSAAQLATARPAVRGFGEGQRRVLVVLFLVQLVLLTWLVVWKLEVPHIAWGEERHMKLTPFVASEGYAASKPLEFLANIAIFVPFGAYLGLLAPRGVWAITLLGAAASSLAMESAQFVLAVGSFDTSDIIGNTAGAMLGLALALAARRAVLANRAAVVAACALATVSAVALVGMLYASPVGPWSAAAPSVAELSVQLLG